MIKTKKKNNLLNVIIMFILLPMLALSLFVMSFDSSSRFSFVSADYVDNNYSYNSSLIYIPIRRNNDSSNLDYCDFLVWSIDLRLDSDNSLLLDISDTSMFKFVDDIYWDGTHYNFTFFDNSLTFSSGVQSVDLSSSSGNLKLLNPGNDYYSLHYKLDSGFNCNVISVEFGNYGSSGDYWNYVKYVDSNNKSFEISFYIKDILHSSDLLSYRVYYLDTNLTDNEAYNSGYNAGKNDGYLSGESAGYTDGYNVGKNDGYNIGYNKGIENSGNYSFLALIGAVIDAPISAFTSLLNFELLGVNLLSFICGLLTLAIIIFVIKLFLGGK